ncbi:MAG: ABC transporter ATP-binding protein [Leeuwenhoekiella sp.]|uniref:ABC transporter ATP-binding protein n=1 Tax=Leeuwenhoekiella TaxID=283735 RepID=UPI000C40B0D0|nr:MULTISPECIES: ABC transporter ATP-binding protein [Leeuwenhoekiella]MAO44649.1 ABC transporter ATP-binding protein [Leeuwenhoekiella sp.]HCW64517.1 ABC transporter ATP-binding protein [Leeuwenhoekiella sp.]|tara:strand:+ start:6524 stop:7807 length:1284 start_codon:yes stop_codon:yes gene_type:complete
MKDDIILKIDNLSKQYRLGKVGTGTLGHDINRAWAKFRGKEDPYLKIGAVNDRSASSTSDYVWALKDVNFEVKRGEILGIIGKNGAGKSTLLKILSRVTSPSTGSIKVGGRMASLLEVGTGMHPELTGRENIYLNGAILGMTKAEITCKIDDIIDFSGCQMYIDTPVKRYSSGMGVRLGFAVAAFLEPEILVVDEVLAVGDAEFQKKAIGKMQDISQGEGRTVLFVSHNMESVRNLCTRGLLLEHGTSIFDGSVENTIGHYLSLGVQKNTSDRISISDFERSGTGMVKIKSVRFLNSGQYQKPTTGKPLDICFQLESTIAYQIKDVRLDFRIDDITGNRLLWFSTKMQGEGASLTTSNTIVFSLDKLPLNSGSYWVTTHLSYKGEVTDWAKNAFQFEVAEGFFYKDYKEVVSSQSKILVDYKVSYDV